MNWRVLLIALGALYIFAPKLFYRGSRDVNRSAKKYGGYAKSYGKKAYGYAQRKYDDTREWYKLQRDKKKPVITKK